MDESELGQRKVRLFRVSTKYIDDPPIYQEERGLFHVMVQGKNVTVDNACAKQMVKSALRALEIARKIAPGFPADFTFYCVARMGGYLNIAGQIDDKFINDNDPDNQVAAVLHELVELWQEDQARSISRNAEILPTLAEFLFTGQKRLAGFRKRFKASFTGQTKLRQDKAWPEIAKIVLPEALDQSPEELFNLMERTRNLPENEKVTLIQKAIEQAKQKQE